MEDLKPSTRFEGGGQLGAREVVVLPQRPSIMPPSFRVGRPAGASGLFWSSQASPCQRSDWIWNSAICFIMTSVWISCEAPTPHEPLLKLDISLPCEAIGRGEEWAKSRRPSARAGR